MWIKKDKGKHSVSPLQKEADCPVVVAVTSHAVFESGAEDPDGLYVGGIAFPLLQVGIQQPTFIYVFFFLISYYRNYKLL